MLKFNKPTLITITAPTCSGKSHLLNALTDRGTARIVSTTTRDARSGERQGVDYDFISREQSEYLEQQGAFFELIEFRGTRYGVTHAEMADKMSGEFAPSVVLEPKGLEIYTQKCRENGWDIFKVYVSTTESVRIERLVQRTIAEVLHLSYRPPLTQRYGEIFDQAARENIEKEVPRIVKHHTDRLLSIAGEERRWSNATSWDAIVPGDNLEKALSDLEVAVKWRNRKNAKPTAYHHAI